MLSLVNAGHSYDLHSPNHDIDKNTAVAHRTKRGQDGNGSISEYDMGFYFRCIGRRHFKYGSGVLSIFGWLKRWVSWR